MTDKPLPLDLEPYYQTELGAAYAGDCIESMQGIDDSSIDLICTSPPFALLRQKGYGNVSSDEYVNWFFSFAREFKRVLKPKGSLVIDIGGSWVRGEPVRSLYHFELLIRLCKPEDEGGLGFHLAQELYWYNPAKLPTPAQWVTVERIRVKDAVNTVWWLSPSTRPQHASNRRVLKPYSNAQKQLMKNGYKPKLRPSEHAISDKFMKNNGGAIPPNLVEDDEIPGAVGDAVNVAAAGEAEESSDDPMPVNVIAASNTASNDRYQRRCRETGTKRHPARFPEALPRFIIGLCTEPGDLLLDPFAGSNMTGYVAENLGRRWLAFELDPTYLDGSKFRFPELDPEGDSENVESPADDAAMNNVGKQQSLFEI